jgi:hypothetical protein
LCIKPSVQFTTLHLPISWILECTEIQTGTVLWLKKLPTFLPNLAIIAENSDHNIDSWNFHEKWGCPILLRVEKRKLDCFRSSYQMLLVDNIFSCLWALFTHPSISKKFFSSCLILLLLIEV